MSSVSRATPEAPHLVENHHAEDHSIKSHAIGRHYFDSPLAEIEPLILTDALPDAFEQFVCALPSNLQLRRAGLVIAHSGNPASDSSLSVIAISENNKVCAGLGIAIPRENSALHEICDSRCLKTIIPAEDFRGNFVERHALLVSPAGCMGMYPLELNQLTFGVVTLNCDRRSEFNGASEDIHLAVSALCRRIADVAPRAPDLRSTPIDN